MDIISLIRERQPDYSAIKEGCFFRMVTPPDEKQDVCVIVPVLGRTQFHRTLTRHFERAIQHSGKKISLTFVEHSDSRDHFGFLADWVNYIHIPMEGKPFNKSLAHNIGAICSPDCDYYLFHDVDIIVPPEYFMLLFQNLEKGYDAMQTFSKRRLFQANEYLTGKLFVGEQFFHVIPWQTRHIKENESGASGGSMICAKELFMSIGGFDPELYTEYSIEDQMFFDKLKLCGRLGFCDDPPIDLVHLWHEPSFNRTTKDQDWNAYDAFKALSLTESKEFFSIKRMSLLKHTSGKFRDFFNLVEEWKKDCADPDNLLAIQYHPFREKLMELATIPIANTEWTDVDNDILALVIQDLWLTQWVGWFDFLSELTGCKIVPIKYRYNSAKAVWCWQRWYQEVYLK